MALPASGGVQARRRPATCTKIRAELNTATCTILADVGGVACNGLLARI
jgi:hypothetical protein